MARCPFASRRSSVLLVFLVFVSAVDSSVAQRPRRGAALHGVVRDSAGTPVPSVEVGVTGSGMHAHTDDSGAYGLSGLAPGPATLTARRIGYQAFSQELRLEAGEERRVDIRLTMSASMLSGIDVMAPREPYDSRLAGFNARSAQHVGHFVTRDRIERANSANLSDLLREMPGVRIGPVRNQGRMIRFRGASCPPLVFVDGFPAAAGEFDVDMMDLRTVEGVEVYSGVATVPPEFSGPRGLDRCGVIAIWSRPARPRSRLAVAPDSRTEWRTPATLSDAYTVDQVDVAARLDGGGLRPSYPDSLSRAGVAGRVVVEFVVDTLGRVDSASVDVMLSSDPLFTLAVRQALAETQFTVARRGARRVRQVMQLPVSFSPSASPAPIP